MKDVSKAEQGQCHVHCGIKCLGNYVKNGQTCHAGMTEKDVQGRSIPGKSISKIDISVIVSWLTWLAVYWMCLFAQIMAPLMLLQYLAIPVLLR